MALLQYLQQQKSYGGFRVKHLSIILLIYNSRNLMVALEQYILFSLEVSTTVEILWWLQRVRAETLGAIYNSRNLMVALENIAGKTISLSTTVEILWWLQRIIFLLCYRYLQQQKSYGGFRDPVAYFSTSNLQQQKSYGGFREQEIDSYESIYNSRNLMVALEYIESNM